MFKVNINNTDVGYRIYQIQRELDNLTKNYEPVRKAAEELAEWLNTYHKSSYGYLKFFISASGGTVRLWLVIENIEIFLGLVDKNERLYPTGEALTIQIRSSVTLEETAFCLAIVNNYANDLHRFFVAFCKKHGNDVALQACKAVIV